MAKTPFNAKHGLNVGTGVAGDQYIKANNGDANLPALRWNDTLKLWEVSNNGIDFVEIGRGSGGSAENLYLEVNQVTHGFDRDFVYHNGTSWVKAQADDSATCATHFAINVDVDNFIAYSMGDIDVTGILDDTGSALVAGDYYFLSQTVAGKITATNPSSGVSQSVMKVNEINKATILIEEPYSVDVLENIAYTNVGNVFTSTDDTYFAGNIRTDAAFQVGNNIITVTDSKTLALTENGYLQKCTNSTSIVLTVPSNSSVEFPIGTEIPVVQYGTGDVSFLGDSGVTINSVDNNKTIGTQYASVALKKINTDEWLLVGNLKA